MVCDKCGTQNPETGKYCSECGVKLGASDQPRTVAPETQVKIGELVYAAHRHRDSGDIEEAILACGGALALNETNAATHILMGCLYEDRGDAEAAKREFRRALVLDPENHTARTRLDYLAKPYPRWSWDRGALIENARSYLPHIAAGVTGVIVLVLLVAVVAMWNDRHGRVPQAAQAASGNTGAQYAAPLVPQVAQQAQNQAATPNEVQPAQQFVPGRVTEPVAQTPPVVVRSGEAAAKTGVPPVPTRQVSKPRESTSKAPALLPLTPRPDQTSAGEPPVIVPVIEPANGGSSGNKTGSSAAKEPSPNTGYIHMSTSGAEPVDAQSKAAALHSQKDWRGAIAQYTEALKQTSDRARVYQQIALCHSRLGENTKAIDAYNKAIEVYGRQKSAGGDASQIDRSIQSCEAGIEACRAK